MKNNGQTGNTHQAMVMPIGSVAQGSGFEGSCVTSDTPWWEGQSCAAKGYMGRGSRRQAGGQEKKGSAVFPLQGCDEHPFVTTRYCPRRHARQAKAAKPKNFSSCGVADLRVGELR